MTLQEIIAGWVAREEWRNVQGAFGYEVSSWGRVRGPRADILKMIDGYGYHHVDLMIDGKKRRSRVHRLVLLAFVGSPPFEDAIAAHNDGDRSNNRVDNLRWASGSENQWDRLRHGTRHKRGSEVRWSKLTDDDVIVIRRRVLSGEVYADIAKDFGVSVSTVSLIKLGRIWKHIEGQNKCSPTLYRNN